VSVRPASTPFSEDSTRTAVLPPTREMASTGYGLPLKVMRQAVRRLGTVALFYSGAYTLIHGLSLVVNPGFEGRWASQVSFALALVSSGAMFAVSRRSFRNPQPALDWGLVYMVVGALAIVFDDFFISGPPVLGYAEITWVGVWIVGFPLLVPSHPTKTLIAAGAAATMTPLSFLVAHATGYSSLPSWHTAVFIFLPNYVCAALAVLGSRVVYSLGTDVTRAQLMGSYHLERLLGRGGMGEVWRARHAMLAFPAAIKLIRPDFLRSAGEEGESLRERFTREARATAALHSPHSIRLFDFGMTEEGTFFYVMELLRGLDLKTLVERHGPVPPERAAFILSQVCHSLADAHAQGLIHRDVKPANIYLCRMGRDDDYVKVLDFGLVSSRSPGEDDLELTSPDRPTPGTPSFMSPEMILRHREVDGRADLYAVGCVAYWLVSGAHVFTGTNVMQILHHHLNTPPLPLSRVAEWDVPPRFDALILSCLEKSPGDRPPSAEALAVALDACEFTNPWTKERATAWWERVSPADVFADAPEEATSPISG
jgi:hypothetical protein